MHEEGTAIADISTNNPNPKVLLAVILDIWVGYCRK